MNIVNTVTGETIGTLQTNHSMTLDEALEAIGATRYPYDPDTDNSDAPTHIMPDGTEIWYDDLEMQ
jgi:hypothetical protein